MPFRFNPFTDKLDLTETGGGSTGEVLSLTTDDGGVITPDVNGNINVFGQKANTVPVVDTIDDSGDLRIENRAWTTQYVVDPSSTAGLRGTFTTIQAAINQVVADGFTFQPFHTIYIRPGTYAENLIMPNGVGISLYSPGPVGSIDQTLNVNLQGHLTFAAGGLGVATFDGIQFTNGGSGNSIDTTGAAICTFRNCSLDTLTGTGAATFFNCNVNACDAFSGGGTFWECQMGGATCQFSGGTTVIKRSSLGNIQVTNAVQLTVQECDFGGGGSGFIGSTGTFTGIIIAESVIMGTQGLFAVNGGDIYYTDISSRLFGNTANIFVTGFTPNSKNALPHFGGNVQQMFTKTANYVVTRQDCYLGADTTGGPITFTLPGASPGGNAPAIGQVFEFKDQGGDAANNNITISGQTIDSGTSVTISQNFGFVKLRWDGTQYWQIPQQSGVQEIFSAYLSAPTGNVTGNNTIYNIICDTVLVNTSGSYDATTGVYTIPEDGIYSFSHTVAFNGGDALTESYLTIWDSTAISFRAYQLTPVAVSPNTIVLSATFTAPYTAGQAIRVACVVGGTNLNVQVFGAVPTSSTVTTLFSGFKVA